MDIRCISTKGNYYEVGFQHGKLMASEIKKNFQYYMSTWLSGSEKSERKILDRAMEYIPHIMDVNPGLVEEIKGVAAGAGLSMDQVTALNTRWELNYAYLPDMADSASGGCTAFALTPESSNDGNTYVGQNWDYKPPLQGQCLAMKIEITNNPIVYLFTEAGIIGHKGFNSKGIGIGVNFIKLKRDSSDVGVPFLIKARTVLEHATLDECLAFLHSHPGPNSGNMLIGSKEGKAVDVECNPSGIRLLKPQEGVLVHSNHFQELEKDDVDIGCKLLPDTFCRTARLYAHFHDKNYQRTEDKIEEGLRDHSGFPNSICRHEDKSVPPATRWQTLLSFYANLDTGKVKFAAGPPCQTVFKNPQFGEEN
jgi:isopenicillin-N N-acyltransferase-like protein